MIRRLTDDMMAVKAAPFVAPSVVADTPLASIAGNAAGYSDGYREGFEAGEEDGRREADVRLSKLEDELRLRHEQAESSLLSERERISSLLQRLAQADAERSAELETRAFEMALLCLSRAFGERAGDGELLGRVLSELTREFRTEALMLQVSDADRSLLPEHVDGIGIEANATMLPGSCALVTRRGRVETSIAERLNAIHRAMMEAAHGTAP